MEASSGLVRAQDFPGPRVRDGCFRELEFASSHREILGSTRLSGCLGVC
jgi:hypothetical protein